MADNQALAGTPLTTHQQRNVHALTVSCPNSTCRAGPGERCRRAVSHPNGWSVQVPARQAAERNEAQITRWRQEAWPVIKASSSEWMVARAEMARVPAAAGWVRCRVRAGRRAA